MPNSLEKSIGVVALMVKMLSPMTAISVSLGGYDDDEREICEIPEARNYILDFAEGILKTGIPLDRFAPDTVQAR